MKLEREQLLKYLKAICTLEITSYELSELASKIQIKIHALQKWQTYKKHSLETYRFPFSDFLLKLGIFIGIPISAFVVSIVFAFMCGLFAAVFGIFWDITDKVYDYIFWIVIGLGMILAIIIDIFIVYDFINNEREKRYKDLEKEIENQIIDEKNIAARKYIAHTTSELNYQLEIIKSKQDETCNTLEKLYSYNIISHKYRNVAAVFSLYEFIESGRCDNLEGYDGAYNLYEELVSKKIVMDKLDDIIENIDEVSHTQHNLCTAILDCNKNVDELCNQMFSTTKALKALNDNVEINNFYNGITEQNTEFLKIYESWI